MRVLLVHPDPDICGHLASRLYRTGRFVVSTAFDGFDAAAKLFGGRFDALVLHVRTPGIIPDRAIRRIRGEVSTVDLPILVIYRELSRARRRSLLEVGANELLREPFPERALVDGLSLMTGLLVLPEHEPEPEEPVAPLPPPPEPQPEPEPEPSPTREPIHLLQAPDQVPSNLIDQVWNRTEKGPAIPGLPPGTSRLDDVISGSLGEYVSKDVLSVDVGLAVSILRMANSVGFAGLEKTSGLNRALLRVGQRGVGRYILNTYEARARTSESTKRFLLDSFWRHSLMVACLSEEMAAHMRHREPDAVFSAGLVHDVGKVFLIDEFPEVYDLVLRRAHESEEPDSGLLDICDVEREVMKIDHGVVGYELTRAWAMPPVVQLGTLNHQLDSDRVRRSPDSVVAKIVGLADLIDRSIESRLIHHLHPGAPEREEEPAVPPEARELQEVLGVFFETLYETAPYWVHEFLRNRRIPLQRAYESARRRVNRARQRSGIRSYGPSEGGASPERRKTG